MMQEPGIPDHLTPLHTACPQRLDGRWRSDQHDDGYLIASRLVNLVPSSDHQTQKD